jgi:hypothetical protein
VFGLPARDARVDKHGIMVVAHVVAISVAPGIERSEVKLGHAAKIVINENHARIKVHRSIIFTNQGRSTINKLLFSFSNT